MLYLRQVFQDIVAPAKPSSQQLAAGLAPWSKTRLTRLNAASVIVARVRLVSLLFAILVPLCAPVDVWLFDGWTAAGMVALRLATSAAFLTLAWPRPVAQARSPYRRAMVMLLLMSLVPSLFYLASLGIIGDRPLTSGQHVVMDLYALMPTVVLAGLAIFPLSALETLLLSMPAVATATLGLLWSEAPMSWGQGVAVYWFMLMAMGVSVFSGMMQSFYMETLVLRAMTDPLTGALNRRAGNEMLARLWDQADKENSPLAVVFFDIDHFKQVNDRYGHEAGDRVLVDVAAALRSGADRHGYVVRWGGEEFVVLLPGESARGVLDLLARMRQADLAVRQGEAPLTASAGWAERSADHTPGMDALVTLADQRMYEAKRTGRARAVGPGGQTLGLRAEG